MDAFENLVAMLLRRDGYWTATSVKVELTPEEKRRIGRHSSPRWEIDVVAYQGATNRLLAIECKSYLDSGGVVFRNGQFEQPHRYKLFTDAILRETVLSRLRTQLINSKACSVDARLKLGLAAGHIARRSDRTSMSAHFQQQGWELIDEAQICERLKTAAKAGYENDVAHVVAKLLERNRRQDLDN